MKLGIISLMEGYPWGGSEELWLDLATIALSKGSEVQISVKYWNNKNDRLDELREKGAVIRFRKKSFFNSAISKACYELGLNDALSPLRGYYPDVILFSEGSAFELTKNLYWTHFALKTKIPYCIIIQNVFESEPLNTIRRQRALEVYNKAKSIYFVSKRNLEVVQRQLAFKFTQTHIVNNPVQIPAVIPYNLYKNIQHAIIHFASIGRLDCHSKGQDILLQALSTHSWKTRKWHLNIYGTGQDNDHLQALTNFLNLNDRVTLWGYKPISEIWSNNHLLIMPSYNEGTSLALLEAMSYGIPAVVTDVGGQAEWIQDGVNGFTVAAPTVELVQMVLEKCWLQKSNWEEMGHRARKKIIESYNISAGQQLFNLIQHDIS